MAKSKNASTHHRGRKIHKNGIKKPLRNKYSSLKACNQRFLRNRRFAMKGDPSVKKNKNVELRLKNRKAKQ